MSEKEISLFLNEDKIKMIRIYMLAKKYLVNIEKNRIFKGENGEIFQRYQRLKHELIFLSMAIRLFASTQIDITSEDLSKITPEDINLSQGVTLKKLKTSEGFDLFENEISSKPKIYSNIKDHIISVKIQICAIDHFVEAIKVGRMLKNENFKKYLSKAKASKVNKLLNDMLKDIMRSIVAFNEMPESFLDFYLNESKAAHQFFSYLFNKTTDDEMTYYMYDLHKCLFFMKFIKKYDKNVSVHSTYGRYRATILDALNNFWLNIDKQDRIKFAEGSKYNKNISSYVADEKISIDEIINKHKHKDKHKDQKYIKTLNLDVDKEDVILFSKLDEKSNGIKRKRYDANDDFENDIEHRRKIAKTDGYTT